MSEFIKVEINFVKCLKIDACGRCVNVCPVNIFGIEGNSPAVIYENEDECILCNLCIEACDPGAITIRKLYEE